MNFFLSLSFVDVVHEARGSSAFGLRRKRMKRKKKKIKIKKKKKRKITKKKGSFIPFLYVSLSIEGKDEEEKNILLCF